MKVITIEGYTQEEILSFPQEQLDAFVFSNAPVVLKIGSAEILGEFKLEQNKIIVELAHIDGGGEGVLSTLSILIERYAKTNGIKQVEWIVHALNCAKPNIKLRRVIERRGFTVKKLEDGVEAYFLLQDICESKE